MVDSARIDGSQDEVVLSLALVAAVVLIAFAGSRRPGLALIPLVAGISAAVLTGSDLHDVGDIGPHVNEQMTAIDWGFYLTALGSVSLVLASMVMVAETGGHGSSA